MVPELVEAEVLVELSTVALLLTLALNTVAHPERLVAAELRDSVVLQGVEPLYPLTESQPLLPLEAVGVVWQPRRAGAAF